MGRKPTLRQKHQEIVEKRNTLKQLKEDSETTGIDTMDGAKSILI